MDAVDENEERMPDIPLHPRILAEWEEQERQEQDRQKRAQKAARRKAAAAEAQKKRVTSAPQTQTHAPHVSTAQRRRNQADQPRDRDGKYGRRPMERLRNFLSHEPPPKTNLKKVAWPHPAGESGGRSRPKSKKTRALPSIQKMVDRPLHEGVEVAKLLPPAK